MGEGEGATGSMAYECYAHLPLLRLVDGEQVALSRGRLVALPFEEWCRLDGSFPRSYDDYMASRPAFFEARIDGPPIDPIADPERRVLSAFRAATSVAHDAVLLATRQPVMDPAMSVCYVRSPDRGVAALIGPLGREAVVYAHGRPIATLDSTHVADLALALDAIETCGDLTRLPDLYGALRTLARTSRPEYSPLTQFVQCVIALEAILMPEARRRLTETFTRRASMLLITRRETRKEYERRCRKLYKVRSEALHGRDVTALLGPDPGRLLASGRVALSLGTLRALTYVGRTGEDLSALRAELDRADSDEHAFLALRGRISGVES